MTLERFEEINTAYVKEIDGKKQYLEDKLLRFINASVDKEAIEKFGEIPSDPV